MVENRLLGAPGSEGRAVGLVGLVGLVTLALRVGGTTLARGKVAEEVEAEDRARLT